MDRTSRQPGQGHVLFVCTGNQCRSPMAEAILRRFLQDSCSFEVDSVGTAGSGTPPPPEAVQVMRDRGLDISGRPSRPLTADAVAAADLVVAMARQHLVDVVTTHPPAWERSFTLVDLVDRLGRAGGIGPGESLPQWARRMSAGRTRTSVLTASGDEDIPDPIGGELRDYEQVRDLLERLVGRLAGAICPGAPVPEPAAPEPLGTDEIGSGRRWWRRRR